MLQHWFRASHRAQLSQLAALLNVIAYGDTLQQQRLIYAWESLPEEVRLDCLQSLKRLRAQTSPPTLQDETPLQIVEQYSSGRFLLLIVQVPWLADPENRNFPLLLAKHVGKWWIVGLSQPWVGLLAQFSDRELRRMQTLSAIWVQYLA